MIDENLLGFRAERERDTVRMATVVKVLRDRMGGDIVDWRDAARTILADLDAIEPAPAVATEEWLNPDFGLTQEQEIRARALDAAARVFGPAVGEVAAGYDTAREFFLDVSGVWVDMAAVGTQFIATGAMPPAEPLPPQEGAGVADDESTVEGQS